MSLEDPSVVVVFFNGPSFSSFSCPRRDDDGRGASFSSRDGKKISLNARRHRRRPSHGTRILCHLPPAYRRRWNRLDPFLLAPPPRDDDASDDDHLPLFETGGRRDATGLLKQPRKAQLRTGSCNQVSRVCSPNGRHDRSLDAAAAAAAVMNDGGVGRGLVLLALGPDGHLIHCTCHFSVMRK